MSCKGLIGDLLLLIKQKADQEMCRKLGLSETVVLKCYGM